MAHNRKVGFWLAGRLVTIEFEHIAHRQYRQHALTKRIQQRLATEDYTCRLPKGDIVYTKPRIRYKLKRANQWWKKPPRIVWK